MNFNFTPTGVGSVPWVNVEESCRLILGQLPQMPFWPQFVNLSPLEDMVVQFSEGLPGLRMQNDGRTLLVASERLEDEMASFYEKFLSDDLDAFAISPDCARGLYKLLDLMEKEPSSGNGFIKGQSIGPITFASSVSLENGRYLLHDPGLLDAVIKGLSIKLLWQAKTLAGTGKAPVIFIDEPALSGIGSAFFSMDRAVVVQSLGEMIDYCRNRCNALIGIHCCANTDWPAIFETSPDIINFDAYGFLDSFLLYAKDAGRFLDAGGTIAWGIAPTTAFDEETRVDSLVRLLERGITKLADSGRKEEDVRARSMITSACGMGSMHEDSAKQLLRLLAELGRRMH